MKLVCRDRVVSLERTAVMGVLNVTPDSFSDGGLWMDPTAAVDHAAEMVEQGAAIVDVGGESTRPGSEPVELDEELRRVIPVIEGVVQRVDAPVSIDTRKPEVARRALEAGASIVNDTTGEAAEPDMGVVAAEFGAAVVTMHSRGTPATMRTLTEYGDVVEDVRGFLAERARLLESQGVNSDSIVIDPGFGFAKSPRQNLVMLDRFDEFCTLGYPVLAGTSRKSFIGAILDLPEGQRVEGTLATVALAVSKGARIVRVHDVQAAARAVLVTDAVIHSSEP